ncbi:MAG: hypothetical protein AB1467_02495 [Candidatus Diapherotrites archaeon]
MRMPSELKFFVLLFLFFLMAVIASQHWHTLAVQEASLSVSLDSYTKIVSPDSQACFALEFNPLFFPNKKTIEVNAFNGSKTMVKDKIELYKEKESMQYCFSSGELNEGMNLIEINAGQEKLFFHLEKKELPGSLAPEIKIISLNEDSIEFSLTQYSTQAMPVKIFVNGILDHQFIPPEGKNEFKEKIALFEGLNSVKISYDGITAEKSIEFQPKPSMNLVAGVLIIVLALFVFSFFVFSKTHFAEKISLSIAFFLILLIFNGFALNAIGFLNLTSFVVLFLIELLLIAFFFRKNFSFGRKMRFFSLNLVEVFAILFLVFFSLMFHFFTPSHFTFYNNYYERESAAIAENFSIPKIDELSYLGRGFAFIPGYFLANAGMSWLTGLQGQPLFALIIALSNIFFVFSVFYLCSALKFDRKLASIALFLIWSSSIIFSFAVITPRHMIALAMLFVALACLVKKRSFLLSGFFLGFASFIQFPLLLIFFFLYVFLARKIEWKPLIQAFVIGFIIVFLLFFENLLAFGLPVEIRPSDWGYMINYPINVVLSSHGILLFFFAVFFISGAIAFYRKPEFIFSYKSKLFLGIIVGFILQALLTSRFDVPVAVVIAFFLIAVIEKDKIFDRRIFLTVMLIGAFLSLLLIPNFVLSSRELGAFNYLKENSSTDARILSDPWLGHSVTFFSQRKVLADLWVEYADEGKLADAYYFLKNSDYNVLKKYKIDFVINYSDIIYEKILDNKPSEKAIEFYGLDKVYSADNKIYIHWAQN